MNETEEKRVCKKCGKRLPSSNNYCMYCGCNNNLSNEELDNINKNKIQQSDNNIPNKIETREKNPLKINLLYVFILLDIIIISLILLFKSDGLIYEKFSYNLNNYDEVININNNSFLVLKNKKIKILGETNISNETINKINKNNVLDIGETYPGSGKLLIEVKNKIYSLTSYDSLLEHKIKETSGNIYKDINTQVYYKTNENNDYYNVLDDENYFIKNNALYMNEKSTTYSYNKYKSKLILDKESLDIKNPKIIGSSYNQESIIVKGDNIIKIFTNGKLIQSIETITYNNKKYNINDFKYIFLHDENNYLFILKNGYKINFYSNELSKIISSAERYGTIKSTYKNLIKNNNLDIDKYTTSATLKDFKISYLKYIDYKIIIVLLIIIIILIGLLYYYRESSIITTSFIMTAALYIILLILSLYSTSKMTNPKYWDTIKESFRTIPLEFIIAFILSQIKEISKYILNKFNIETIYHFPLMIICLTCSFLAITVLTNNLTLFLILPGIVWAFLTLNNEEYNENELEQNDLFKIIITILISLLLGLIICSVFGICNYYLFIIPVAFCIACYIILNNNISITDYLKRFVAANISLFLTFGVIIIYGLISMLSINDSLGKELVNELMSQILKYTVIGSLIEIIFIILICLIISLVLYGIKNILKNILNNINNRILKIFIVMLVMVIIISIIIILIPYITELLNYIFKLVLGDSSSLNTNLFSLF